MIQLIVLIINLLILFGLVALFVSFLPLWVALVILFLILK